MTSAKSNPFDITDEQYSELNRLWNFYKKESHRCMNSKAYLAGCVMAGAVLETMLILIVNMYPEEAAATNKLPTHKGIIKPLLKWTLAELLAVAKAAGWLPSGLELSDSWNSRKARIGDYAEITRQLRNLLHPAKYMTEHYRGRVTLKQAQLVFDVMDGVNNHLGWKCEKSLSEKMGVDDGEA